ncbi:2-amino-4-hydroxy-6-hydroxymethyldihydropteridine diphosphokinase [Shewanella aestuarii]|uniref:2-amino-4-hydroxy-6-hydroxymethyldihydropteridine pyrophosphokinase n=1 Tax=Shewanella aestuarii TaxID=1028752 RepID=A0A6G9QHU6_9GAMM|nr:2-amino-4-hydroxy-6-hydroxymethyldihydropteridine diphosphokinase [Shewanella aestuarii]QIR13645.1 2-amino-4-hydroxy-6-hydroxymethyldihydropteridine diphosphokinase [Shewanella aestuarii]
MAQVYVALGANLADPIKQLNQAVVELGHLAGKDQVIVSSYYSSTPMGDIIQPDYVNAVAGFQTELTPLDLLDALQAIENRQGRVREQRWGPRTLDLDLLLYGNQMINTPRLTVPHYGMKQRDFVLVPLAEIATNLVLPTGEPLNDLVTEDMSLSLHKISNP